MESIPSNELNQSISESIMSGDLSRMSSSKGDQHYEGYESSEEDKKVMYYLFDENWILA